MAATTLLNIASCRDEYNDLFKAFYRTKSSINNVPDDIPEEAMEVYLNDNNIAVLKRNAFSNLEQCTKLYLDHNGVAIIESRAFKVEF